MYIAFDILLLMVMTLNKRGFKGKDIGNILNKLLDMVMREDVRNNREELLAAVSKFR